MHLITITSLKHARTLTGTLSAPSKMPCSSYSFSPAHCQTGRKLAKIPGSVCHGCYAYDTAKEHGRGNYSYPSVQSAWKTRFDAMHNLETWKVGMKFQIAREGNAYFRWHDAGDLQSVAHLEAIAWIATQLPTIRFWLPTKEYAYVRKYLAKHHALPANLTVRLSAHMIDGPVPNMGLPVSSVSNHGKPVPAGAERCPAPENHGQCGECRNCWNAEVKQVDYLKH